MNRINPIANTARQALAFTFTLGLVAFAHAHALWIVPTEGGYRIQYGEPGEGLLEKKEKLEGLGPMVIRDAAGKTVKGLIQSDHVLVSAGNAGVTVSAVEAPLYGEGEHAGRPFWHARFVADPGKKMDPAPGASFEILPDGKDSLSFAVIKGGKPWARESVTLFAPSGWNKSFKTDAAGKLRIETPWPGLYVLEAGVEEEVSGKFKDKPYAKVYNAYTLSFLKR
jgi:hypothetical protein